MARLHERFLLSRSPAIVLVAAIAVLILFVNKPFHMDDPLFIWSAQQIQDKPLDFYGLTANWYGTDMSMSDINKNPPLVSYFIALIASVFGFNEAALHVGFLLPACAVAVGTFCLGRYFGINPVLASIVAVFSPVFVVSSTAVMSDTMMLAFWIWSIVLWLYGLRDSRKSYLLAASVLMSLCFLSKYFGLALIPLLLLYSVVERKPFRSYWLYLLIPLVAMILFQWYTFRLYGKNLIADAASYATEIGAAQQVTSLRRLLIGLAFTGGCLLPVLFLSYFIWSRRVIGIGVLSAVVLNGAVYLLRGTLQFRFAADTQWALLVSFSVMVVVGIGILVLAAVQLFKNRNSATLLLFLWIAGTFVFTCFVNWTVSARNILPMAPAVGILVALRLEQNRTKTPAALFYALIASALAALAVGWSDYALARSAKQAAAYVGDRYGSDRIQTWFQGHWGFQYYMQQAGFKPVNFSSSSFRPGDIVVLPTNNTNLQPMNREFSELLEVRQYELVCPASIMKGNEAGFYSSVWGIVPFLPAPPPGELYLVFVIKPSD